VSKTVETKPNAELKPCACGCGEMVLCSITKNGTIRKFKNHHNLKQIPKSGESNHKWKGGRKVSHGYVLVLKPDHHYSNCDGYVREHRVVWEEHNKACLLPWGEVHHINKITTDNRIENLMALIYHEHKAHHRVKDVDTRVCAFCGSNKTYSNFTSRNRPRIRWYKNPLDNNEWLCSRCFNYWKYWEAKDQT
jgi:hypothetical protein